MISKQKVIDSIPFALKTVNLPKFGKKHSGKVRDSFALDSKRIIVTTDRQSAFDHVLGLIPFKGQVLTRLSEFWFKKTADIIQNHLLSVPDPNVMLVKNCQVIPIEMVIRGYITGVTDTSIWGSYEKGERTIYGIKFPEGLRKNQKLPEPVITPTTKAETGHDERLTEKEILQRRIVTSLVWKQMKKAALALFERGQKICESAGIILVDTKYEFGLDGNGKLILVDEIHTPDSSRYWIKKTYKKRFEKKLEPESYDKEPLRIWFKEHGYSGKGKIPKMPPEFIAKMSMLYMGIYEKITGKKFIPDTSKNVNKRIKNNLKLL
ncbi:phosphoribosylaminoimidazolesuccinocarboxamide synthase [Candidatus Daviesbacteria bacterium RIFCSPLOWO2_02_FULL_41_8]|uniref:Phosphoribosylaminoimidazole-succinocarboxamide synthase n=3 Tax=Candidatus Daviesiibacteriota TaxID=1752718 RepID=A0A1F5NM08_9BACT|nr:MAG: phosphoribosylaminoimidazolesuccinocarboxamide synthase [Candidatus Daviesbacteria bacterium RIFCSPHIGHO2_01_FULL_41_23]OGE33345.1 MAG: phosphoribosylaminoimidazolesuccinocarboxamide synthase [Candidatus Daviesbacteria bacterium RIFCSPHIGHO2_02_FULL_41_10]OGE78756.1 MAG: phosphoribosylaminoimidazolesuccinocarboxamide synthase [Candidatus Daviesbacteria bacterium RIFCSPLOWO2_02_FULL_41_8]